MGKKIETDISLHGKVVSVCDLAFLRSTPIYIYLSSFSTLLEYHFFLYISSSLFFLIINQLRIPLFIDHMKIFSNNCFPVLQEISPLSWPVFLFLFSKILIVIVISSDYTNMSNTFYLWNKLDIHVHQNLFLSFLFFFFFPHLCVLFTIVVHTVFEH